MVQGIRIQLAIFGFIQLSLEILDGAAHHETVDLSFGPLPGLGLADESENLRKDHGFRRICRGVRNFPSIPSNSPVVVRVMETTTQCSHLAGSIFRDYPECTRMEPNEGISSFGNGRDIRAMRMVRLGGRRFGRWKIGRGGLIGTHHTELNHHGILHGALFFWGGGRNTDGDLPACIRSTDPGDRLGDVRLFTCPLRISFGRGIRLQRCDHRPFHHR